MSDSSTPVRLGIIGTGIAAFDLHWPALKALRDRFRIVAVANRSPEKARRFAALVGSPRIYPDYHALLQDPAVEAVSILLPIHLNAEVTKEALEAGKHVLLEKPLAANFEDARKMRTWPEVYSPLKMMVAENYRYAGWFLRLKERLNAGEIGRPYALRWDLFVRVLPETSKYARTTWRIHHRYPGGFILDGGVHNAAVLRLLGGEVSRISALADRVNPAIGELDTLNAQIQFSSGLQGQLNLFYSSVGLSVNEITAWGSEGTFRLLVGTGVLQKRLASGEVEEEKIEDDGGYRAEYENFFEAIRLGKSIRSTFEEGYRDMLVILKALESARKGRVVNFK